MSWKRTATLLGTIVAIAMMQSAANADVVIVDPYKNEGILRSARLPGQYPAGQQQSPMEVAMFQASPMLISTVDRSTTSIWLAGAPGPEELEGSDLPWVSPEPEEVDTAPFDFKIDKASDLPSLDEEKIKIQKKHESMEQSTVLSMPLVKIDSKGNTIWIVERGLTLRQVLEAWSSKATWSLSWMSDHEYVLQASAEFTGDFVAAATSLLASFEAAEPPVIGKFYTGNHVLVVSTSFDYGN